MPASFWDQDDWDSLTAVWLDNPLPPGLPTKRKAMDEFALKLQDKTLEDKETLSIDIEEGLTTTTYVPTGAALVTALSGKRAAITLQKGKVSVAESKVAME